jgi:HEAT repeat protein
MSRDDLARALKLATSEDWAERADAIRALSGVDDPRAIAAVERGLDDCDLAVVGVATAALLDAHRGMPLLQALTKEEEVATYVGDLLADSAPAWFEEFLIELVQTESAVMDWRVAAADTLGFVLESKRAIPVLRAAVEEAGGPLSAAARGAIEHLVPAA